MTADTTRERARLQTWLSIPYDHPFGIQTLPYGAFTTARQEAPRVGVRIGNAVLDLTAASTRLLPEPAQLFAAGTLDPLMGAGAGVWAEVRGVAPGLARRPVVPSRHRAAAPSGGGRRHDTAVHSCRLRRLLRLRTPRNQPRTHVPPGPGAAAAELEAPVDRLPRSRPAPSSYRAHQSSGRTASG